MAEASNREPTIAPGRVAHALPKPTIVSQQSPLERASRVAEANNRELLSEIVFEFDLLL